jgi:uncharacterized membrane protein YphA (DoxX/SURF4 family)
MTTPTMNRSILEPSPHTLGLITLFLRLGLGVGLVETGLTAFLLRRMGGARFNPMFTGGGVGLFPPGDALQELLPFAQIAVGLALALGFFTGFAAATAAILMIVQPLLRTVFMMIAGQSMLNPGMPVRGMPFMIPGVSFGLDASNLFLAAAVLWLAPVRSNPWSLDALMFPPRETQTPAPAAQERVADTSSPT